ncbi:MAG: hypothetical protein JWN73_3593 [Betaproteobacteria bacterium]|nr:hypothetical protein [Betaproteobacteria bacterium]
MRTPEPPDEKHKRRGRWFERLMQGIAFEVVWVLVLVAIFALTGKH